MSVPLTASITAQSKVSCKGISNLAGFIGFQVRFAEAPVHVYVIVSTSTCRGRAVDN